MTKELEIKQKFIFHIFPREKFTDEYIKLINKNFNKQEHIFLLYGKEFNTVSDIEDNVVVLHKKCVDLILYLKLLYRSKGIIVHSLTNSRVEMSIFLQPWLLSKFNIVFWGADLYSYREKKVRFKTKVREFVRSILIKNGKYITTLISGDYELARKWYKTKGISLSGIYINLASQDSLNNIKKNQNNVYNKKQTTNIQIGNNAQRSNQHLEAINLVSRFKDHNIKVYAPLSYGGEKEYIEQVIEYGKKLLGDKFVPLLEFVPVEKYNEYLSTIDISIFCNDRQQAMGNIGSLVYLGSKVFLRSDTAMWKYFTQELGYSLEKIEDIKDMTFEEFIHIEQERVKINEDKVSKLRSENNAVEKWKKIFKYMGLS